MADSHETLYWTVGGVAIGLIALIAFSSKGSGSGETVSSTPAISASDLTSQVNTVNTNSAQVEQTFLNDRTALAIAQNTNQLNYVTAKAGDHAAIVETHMNDVSAQHINAQNAAASEYAAREQAVANMYEATQARIVGVTSANDTLQGTKVTTQGAVQVAQIAGTTQQAVAKTQASAEEAVASTQAGAQEQASTNNLLGGIFGGVLAAFGI